MVLDSPAHRTSCHDMVKDVVCVAVHNEEKEEVTIFAVNRNLEEDLPLEMDIRSFPGYHTIEKIELAADDLQAVNSLANECVKPHAADDIKGDDGRVETVLKKASWNVIRLGK